MWATRYKCRERNIDTRSEQNPTSQRSSVFHCSLWLLHLQINQNLVLLCYTMQTFYFFLWLIPVVLHSTLMLLCTFLKCSGGGSNLFFSWFSLHSPMLLPPTLFCYLISLEKERLDVYSSDVCNIDTTEFGVREQSSYIRHVFISPPFPKQTGK